MSERPSEVITAADFWAMDDAGRARVQAALHALGYSLSRVVELRVGASGSITVVTIDPRTGLLHTGVHAEGTKGRRDDSDS